MSLPVLYSTESTPTSEIVLTLRRVKVPMEIIHFEWQKAWVAAGSNVIILVGTSMAENALT